MYDVLNLCIKEVIFNYCAFTIMLQIDPKIAQKGTKINDNDIILIFRKKRLLLITPKSLLLSNFQSFFLLFHNNTYFQIISIMEMEIKAVKIAAFALLMQLPTTLVCGNTALPKVLLAYFIHCQLSRKLKVLPKVDGTPLRKSIAFKMPILPV